VEAGTINLAWQLYIMALLILCSSMPVWYVYQDEIAELLPRNQVRRDRVIKSSKFNQESIHPAWYCAFKPERDA
jgi:hypothetical protein